MFHYKIYKKTTSSIKNFNGYYIYFYYEHELSNKKNDQNSFYSQINYPLWIYSYMWVFSCKLSNDYFKTITWLIHFKVFILSLELLAQACYNSYNKTCKIKASI